MNQNDRQTLLNAIRDEETKILEELLSQHEELRDALSQAETNWGGPPPLALARSIETAQRLLDHGARLDVVSEWWKRGFGVIKHVDADVGRFLVDQGATVSPHAAAGLGLADLLRDMIQQEALTPSAKGGDDATPLHFARTVETASVLIDAGANLDARDGDHGSTAAQWLIGDAPEVARHILKSGARGDIFVAAALGERSLAEAEIQRAPDCLSYRVGQEEDNPAPGYEGLGGTILQWSLGFNSYAHQYAAQNGHTELFDLLYSKSDVKTQFLVSCVMARRKEAEEFARQDAELVSKLPSRDLELLARYCWETNVDLEAVRLMLDLGFPIDHPETRHNDTPLHNAAWGGYADLVDLLIERGAPVDRVDPNFGGTPLAHAIHCCCEEGRHPEGEYGRVVQSLMDAGSPWDPLVYPTGDSRIDDILSPRMTERLDGAAIVGDAEAFERHLADSPGEDMRHAALVCAAKGGQLEFCRKLLERGASLGPHGPHGFTPLHRAVSSGIPEIVRLLLEHGADPRVANRFGSTPLHLAGLLGANRNTIDMLIESGGREVLDKKNQFEATPLDWAKEEGHTETCDALRAHGAQ